MSTIVSTVSIAKTVTKAVDDYRNQPLDYVADYVAPIIPVMTQTGYLPRFNRSNQKLINGLVSPHSPSPRIDHGLTTTTFSCEVHRMSDVLPTELETFDDTKLLNAANLGVLVDEALRIEREYELAALLQTAGTFSGNTSSPSTAWNAPGGNPASDVQTTACTAVDTGINRVPEYGLCTLDVALFLRAFVADLRVGGGSAALATMPEVAAYMGLREIRVARAGYNSAKPGNDTATGAKLFGTQNFWVFYKPDQMNAFSPSFMATPRVNSLSRARVEKTMDPEGLFIESRDCYDLVTVDGLAGYYFSTVLS
jgi:hypothetical protein